ncbi:MAG: septum formation protein Maf [Flavobacterium sp.]|nr:MAG: septum formation protein Maf [Flavobacterium sp.]
MLSEKLKSWKIILASGSPRRQQFFKDLHLDFEIRLKETEEIFPPELQASEITDYLARLKASAFEGELAPDEILVTSDTIVWLNGKSVGKPKDYDDAIAILKSLSGATHEVYTSVCFKTAGSENVISDVTKVTFNEITEPEIRFYLDNYKPFDKAGAYGIQDWIGLVAVRKIEGSYANVMGLPVDKVYAYLHSI